MHELARQVAVFALDPLDVDCSSLDRQLLGMSDIKARWRYKDLRRAPWPQGRPLVCCAGPGQRRFAL